VVEPVSSLAATAGPRARAAMRLGLRAFEFTSFPRRFSRLPADRRSAHLARLEAGRGRVRRDLAVLVKTLGALGWARDPEVQRAIGIDERVGCVTSDPGRAPGLRRDALVAEPGVERCDVVIVGSGAGGAAAARALAERGVDVIVLEEGDYHDAHDYSPDPVQALPSLYRDGGLTFCEGTPAIPLPVGRCVGGTTVINSGTSVRPPGSVLTSWRDDHGIDWGPELDDEFEGIERDLAVRPVDARVAGRNAELCRRGADAIGAANGPLPRMAGRVARCARCPLGCGLDAKQAMHVSELPRAVAAGARIRSGSRATKVILDGGRAAGVVCARRHGGHFSVAARAVVLAGGALGTPELLLTQGIANASGQVGRNLRIQPACWVGARFPGEDVRGWEGIMQSWGVGEWLERRLFLEATFSPLPFGAQWMPGAGADYVDRVAHYGEMAVVGVHLADRSRGRVRVKGGQLRIGYRLTEEDAAALRFGIARAAQMHFAAGAAEVYPQVTGLTSIAPGEEKRIEEGRRRPWDLRLEAFHPMGTARMGPDPASSVVALSGESHDVPGLHVADAGVLPTSLGANPMVTIMGVSRRIARGLAERLS
jgi:choline dehydrogenase-like flavoprotein